MFKEPAQNTTQNNQWYESKTRNIFNSRIQNRMFCFHSTLQHDSWLLLTGVPGSIDETPGIINPSVSTSSYSTHSNSWNWNAHKYTLWHLVAICCGLSRGSNGGEGSFSFVCRFLCSYLWDNISLIDARYKPHTEHNRLFITSWAAGQL